MAVIVPFSFWSSGILTGNQTDATTGDYYIEFWSSGILTGNQTNEYGAEIEEVFWSSGILTGNQTRLAAMVRPLRFGAVAF